MALKEKLIELIRSLQNNADCLAGDEIKFNCPDYYDGLLESLDEVIIKLTDLVNSTKEE